VGESVQSEIVKKFIKFKSRDFVCLRPPQNLKQDPKQNISCRTHPGGRGGGLPYKRLVGMCRCMGSHLHDWNDYNGVAFLIVTRMGSHIFLF